MRPITMEDDQVNKEERRNNGGYFTRSKVALEFKAAGVLPFCILPSGEALVLLGAEESRTGPQGRMRKTMCKFPHPVTGCCACLQFSPFEIVTPSMPSGHAGHCNPKQQTTGDMKIHYSQTPSVCSGKDFGGSREAIDTDVEDTASR
jgi:hypothetical protein